MSSKLSLYRSASLAGLPSGSLSMYLWASGVRKDRSPPRPPTSIRWSVMTWPRMIIGAMGFVMGSAFKCIQEFHGFAVRAFRGGAGDLVVAAVLFAVALDGPDDVAAGLAARARLVPLDGNFVAGDEAAPACLRAQVEE